MGIDANILFGIRNKKTAKFHDNVIKKRNIRLPNFSHQSNNGDNLYTKTSALRLQNKPSVNTSNEESKGESMPIQPL